MGFICERFWFIKAQNNARQGFIQKMFFSLGIPVVDCTPSERHGLKLKNMSEDPEQPILTIRNNLK